MEDLDRFLPDFRARVGSHGAEVKDGDAFWRHEAAESDASVLHPAHGRGLGRDRPGVLVEDKPCSVALHFRQAPERMGPGDRFLDDARRPAEPGLQPASRQDGARGASRRRVEARRDRAAHARWPAACPVAFGDDATDEGMFEAVNAAGRPVDQGRQRGDRSGLAARGAGRGARDRPLAGRAKASGVA
jgi:trehalose 6-phosphate phosphatase